MIGLLTYFKLILLTRAKNLVLVLLLLAFGASIEAPYFININKISNEQYSTVMRYVPESPDFPLSNPLSAGEVPSDIEGDFSEDDENFFNLASISFFVSEPIYFHQQSNSLIQESLYPPFTPPESLPVRQAGVTPSRI